MRACCILFLKPAIPLPSSVVVLRSLFPRPFASTFHYHPIPVRGMATRSSTTTSSSSPPPRTFQLRLNPLTGDSEWVVVDGGEDAEQNIDPPGPLLATTSYLDMLNDSRRNHAYRLAIEKTITKPCHVLDIGAGTGLLSMMASRAMEKAGGSVGGEGRVSACESYLPMGKLMRRVLRANGMERNVKVFHKRSDELRVGVELDTPADVLVSEILDSELLGEGLIPTLQHAHDMLLGENPQTIPYRATTYGQLVESACLWNMHDLCNTEAHAPDGVYLTAAGLESLVTVKKQQHSMHCSAISADIKVLSEPFKIFEFDFSKRPDSYGETDKQIKAIDNGNIHAIISWWVLQLDYEGTIFYSTAPNWISSYATENVNKCTHVLSLCVIGAPEWCDHWKQCVWFIPGMGIAVSREDQVFLKAFHDEISISYSLRVDSRACYNIFEPGHLMLSPERIALYGDHSWRLALSSAAKKALQGKAFQLCVIADDSIYLTILLASLSKTSNIISAFPGLQEKGNQYLQAVADANGFSMNHIKVIGKRISSLKVNDLKHEKVGFLAGEPFYYGNDGMLPWQNLRFWKERTILDSVLSEDVSIMPCKGILKACAMFLPDLWRSRRCLGSIEGFDHSVVNETLGACGDLPPLQEGPCLPFFIWQCGEVEELSEVFSIMEFNFLSPIHACSGKTRIGFSKPGLCHGFALWIDWVLDESNSIVISTGPEGRYWKQGVKLLSQPVAVNVGECSAEVEASFDPSRGELTVKSLFSSS